MMRHDSRILSDLLPMGASRAKIETFRVELKSALERQGYMESPHEHSGRRDCYACDRVTVTSPGGWITGHDGSATLKARGCSHFRQAVRALAPAIAAGMGLTYNGIDSRGEYVGKKRANA